MAAKSLKRIPGVHGSLGRLRCKPVRTQTAAHRFEQLERRELLHGDVTHVPLSITGDANGDSRATEVDYAMWAHDFGKSGEKMAADFNGDQTIGLGDYVVWAALTESDGGATTPVPTGLPTILGDANGDCTVGAADYAIWAAQFGQTGVGISADFDGNGSVGAGDYALWAANFGLSCDSPTAAIDLIGTLRQTTDTLVVSFSEPMSANAFATGSYALRYVGGINDGQALPLASVTQTDSQTATLRFPGLLADASYRLTISSSVADAENELLAAPRDFDFSVADPTGLDSTAPAAGEELVGLTREVVVKFDEHVNPATVTADAVYVVANGEVFPTTLRVSSTEQTVTLFHASPFPASTRLRLIVDGNQIIGRDGFALDADGDGEPGGLGQFDFTTHAMTPIPGTKVWGYVFDSNRKNLDGSDVPIVGAHIEVEGLPGVFAVTDETGRFQLEDAPAGEFFVNINASMSPAPAGYAYGAVKKPFHSVAGHEEQLNMMGVPFNIYLPSMKLADVQPIVPGQATQLGFGEQAMEDLHAIDPAVPDEVWQRLQVVVPADSVYFDNGQPATGLTIFALPPDRIPVPLPPGMDPKIVFSVDAAGAQNFDHSAQLVYPNFDNLAPGEQRQLFAFDHDAGEWVITGQVTVSADGLTMVSEPDTGVRTLGWRFVARDPQKKQMPPMCMDSTGSGNADAAAAIAKCISQNEAVAAAARQGVNAWLADSLGALRAEHARLAQEISEIDAAIADVNDQIDLKAYECSTPGLPPDVEATCLAELNQLVDFRQSLRDTKGELGNQQSAISDRMAEVSKQAKDMLASIQAALTAANKACQDSGGKCPSPEKGPSGPTLGPQQATSFLYAFESKISAVPNSQIGDLLVQVIELLAPLAGTGQQISLPIIDAAIALLDDATTAAGGQLSAYFTSFATSIEAQAIVNGSPIHAAHGTAIGAGMQYFASIMSADGTRSEVRGRTLTNGMFQFYIPITSRIEYMSFYDSVGGRYGTAFPLAISQFAVPQVQLAVPAAGMLDQDEDGAPFLVEQVFGTSDSLSDTDNDGISDFAEIQQGLDPLDGRLFPTGVIGSLPLKGEATEVVLAGSILDAQGMTAYVATGSHGLAIVDASRLTNPIVLGQLDLSGTASDVAVDSRLQIAAVAAGSGLHLVDVSDPVMPTLRQTLPVGANRVEVFDGLAWVTVGEELRAYDLLTGEREASLELVNESLGDLAREGSFLYVISGNNRLRVVDVGGPLPVARGSVSLTGDDAIASRLFVGNGVAYVANGGLTPNIINFTDNVTYGGYSTVDVRNPDAPIQIAAPELQGVRTNNLSTVANGSNLVLVAAGDLGVEVHDATQANDTYDLRATLTVPGFTRSLAIGAGIAFVASGASGLQVVNYLGFDAAGQAPSPVTIEVTVGDLDPGTAGIQVAEGTALPVRVSLTEDRQVRNVELLVNGQVMTNDVSFPFDLTAFAPALVGSLPEQLTIQVRATDTGGNSTLSAPFTAEVVEDTFAPLIDSMSPGEGTQRNRGLRRVELVFSEALAAATVTAETFRLLGPAGVVVPLDLQLRGSDRVLQLTYDALPEGQYQLLIDGATVTDRAGNALAAGTLTKSFELTNIENKWVGAASGTQSWLVGANWSRGVVPGVLDNVVIDKAGTYTIASVPGGASIGSLHLGAATGTQTLFVNGSLTLGTVPSNVGTGGVLQISLGTGGTLTLQESLTVTGRLTASSGVITGGGTIIISPDAQATFNGVTAVVDVANLGTLEVGSNVRLRRSFVNAPSATLNVRGETFLFSSNTVTFDRGFTNEGLIDLYVANSNTTWSQLTLGLGETLINAPSGRIRSRGGPANSGSGISASVLENQGLIEVSKQLRLDQYGAKYRNSGTIRITGDSLYVDTRIAVTPYEFVNEGTIELVSSTAKAQFHDLGVVTLDGGQFTGTGSVEFYGVDVAVNAPWTTSGIDIVASSANIVGAGPLTVSVGDTLTLSSSTLATPLSNAGTLLSNGGTNTINADLTNSGELRLVPGTAGPNATLALGANLTNTGTIRLQQALSNPFWFVSTITGGASRTLTNLPGGTIISEGSGSVNQLSVRLDNQNQAMLNVLGSLYVSMYGATVAHENSGTISLTTGNLDFRVDGFGSFTLNNSGTIDIGAGRTLSLVGQSSASPSTFNQSAAGYSGTGNVSLSGVTLNLGTNFTTAGIDIAASSSTINGPGTLTNSTGDTLTLSSATVATPLANAGTMTVSGNSTLNATASNSGNLQVQGGRTLTLGANLTNSGTVQLQQAFSSGSWSGATIAGGASRTLTNLAGGTITSGGGSGSNQWAVRLDNQAMLNVLGGLAISAPSAAHVSSGTIDVSGANLTITQSGTTPSFTNSGTIHVGSARTVTVSGGPLIQTASGRLNFDQASLAQFGKLSAASQAVILAGTVQLTPVDGFVPAVGNAFQVLTYGSRIGTFDTIDGGSVSYSTNYAANAFTVTVAVLGGASSLLSASVTQPVLNDQPPADFPRGSAGTKFDLALAKAIEEHDDWSIDNELEDDFVSDIALG